MKVIIATRLFPPEVGAAAFRQQALANGLAEAGSDVRVITTRPPHAESNRWSTKGPQALNRWSTKGRQARVETHPAPYALSRWPVLRDAGGNVRGYLQYLSFDIPAFFRLLFANADIVVSEPPPTTGMVVALTSLLRRRPFAYYAADVWTEALAATDVPPLVIALMRRAEGFVLRRAVKVLAVSEEIKAQVQKFGVPADRIAVTGNGADTATFTPEGPVPPTQAPYFAYTGTMSEWQGAEIFIEALPLVLKKYPEATIRFFGQGADEPHLRDTAARLAPDNVTFGGVVPPAEAASWIRGAAAALVSIRPGQGYDFARPTKIYAAAACGTPVIFAGTGAGAKVVEEGRLGAVAGFTADKVAQALIAALEQHDDGGRQRRADWVENNASLAACGRRAAAEVLSAAPCDSSVG